MRLSLGVIARAGLGQKMDWPDASAQNTDARKEELASGHKMTFTASLTYLLRNVLYVIILPKWLQARGPFAAARKAHQSYLEWGQYMEEMIAAKRSAVQDEERECATTDLLSQLVKEQDTEPGKSQHRAGLTDSEIMGNLFVMTIAGHETTASSIHFSLVFLALNPQVQKAVQLELNEVFKERHDDISRWDYERDLPRLMNSRLAAVLNEELRLIAPVINIPKFTLAPQQLIVEGREITVPPKTIIRLCVPSVHHNPRFWPSSPRKDSPSSDDLKDFKPERWLRGSSNGDTADHLLVPKRGAYIPFSDGARACLGRRFAQVEILAALALILSQSSVELSVDEWATDEQVDNMTEREKMDVWRKAEEKAKWTLQNKMVCIITLQLRGGCVPVRVVKSGEERFTGLWMSG
jgi:cytochrome P450